MQLKGKPLTLGAKILACAIAIGGLALKATVAPALPIDDVLKVAAFVAGVFVTVDVSLWFEKIFTGRAP